MSLFNTENVGYKRLAYPDISINAMETTFICGASGTGKTTLLKLLNCVLSPTAGTVYYQGRPVEAYEALLLRREILLVGQSFYLFDASVKQNFTQYYSYLGLAPVAERTMQQYLRLCATDLPLESMCGVLSGGERQRVFMAICLSLPSKVLLLDEPTSALDQKTADILLGNLLAHCKQEEKTCLIASHDTGMVEKYANQIISL